MDFNQWNVVWALSYGVMGAAVTFGNIVTIKIFLKRQLRKRAHFLLISLAVADLLVGLLSISLYVTLQYVYDDYEEDYVVVAISEWMDMFTGFTSIFTIAVISLERMYAIGWPFRHRVLTNKTYKIAIAIPWILSFIAASAEIILQYVYVRPIAFIIILIVCLSTPIVLTCTAYSVLWRKSRLLPHGVQKERELNTAKTVALITGAFLVTWLPLKILIVIFNFCISCRDVSSVVVYIIKLVQYGNSGINVLIYPARNGDYKKALVGMLSSCKYSCRGHNPQMSANVTHASVVTLQNLVDLTANRSISSQQTTNC